MRKTGIEILGDVPWGTHFCHFYKNKEDLIDILVPYFKTGLENNELCIWVASEPLKAEEAKAALNKEVKNLDKYIKNGQIEILDASQLYTNSRKFEGDKILKEWGKKENQALARGFDGLRCTGNTSWLEERNWRDLAEYEMKVNNLNGKHRILAVCSYPLIKCGASEVLDIVSSHQFALLRMKNRWEIIESTERKKAYAVMQESEERWRFMVQNTSDIIITVSSDGTVLATNRTVLNITKEDVIGKNIYDYIAPEYCGPMMKSLKRVFQTGKPDNCTILGAGAHGLNTSWYETIIVPIKHNSHVVAVTLINRDITERKKAEEALQESEEKLKTIIESINDIIFQISPSGIIKYVSPKVKELYGYNPKKLVGKHLKKTTPMSDVPKALKALKRVLSGKTVNNFEINQLDAKGRIIPMEINVCPVRKEGKIIAVQGVMRDITERKKAQEAIHIRDLALKSSINAIALADLGGNLIYVNYSFLKMWGYDDEKEILGKPSVKFWQREEKALEVIKELHNKGSWIGKLVAQRKDGLLFNVQLSASMITDEAGKPICMMGSFIDITSREKSEEEEVGFITVNSRSDYFKRLQS